MSNMKDACSFSLWPSLIRRALTLFAALLIVSDVCLVRGVPNEGIRVPAATRPQVGSDLSLTSLQVYGDYFYWIDEADHGVYRARLAKSSRSQARTTLGEPEKVWSGLPVASPVALTVDASGVYVIDSKFKAVFKLTSPAPKLLYSGAPLTKPIAIAATGDRLFLIDAGTKTLYSVDPAGGDLHFEFEFNEGIPDRLLADGNDLIAYYFGTNALLHLLINKEVTKDKQQQVSGTGFTSLTAGRKLTLTKILSSVVDLAFSNGIVYFIDPQSGRLALLPLEGTQPSFIPLGLVSENPRALVASSDSLFFVEGNPIQIRKQPSLQPITFNFLGEWTSKNIVEFYSYLSTKRLLPTKRISVTKTTPLKTLVDELTLLPTGYVDEFQLLFCELNESTCTPEQKKLPLADAPAGFSVSLNAEQSIVVPDLPVTPYITRRNLKLPLDPQIYKPELFPDLDNSSLGKVASQLGPKNLDEQGLREILKRYNTDYLGSDIFSETKGFFSIPIQGARVTAVVPRRDLLDPGSLVRRLAEKKNISGTTPMFLMRKEGFRSQPAALLPPSVQPVQADCLPNDPSIRSAAMDLINYCQPALANTPEVGIIDYGFNPNHPAFAMPGGGSALQVFNQNSQPVDSNPLDVDPARTTFNDVDHGTHIAALIGARAQPGAMVGLLPTANLFGVPLNSVTEALNQWEFLRIFNVSLGEQGATGAPLSGVDDLESVISNYRLKLFVLSAGNDGKEVSKHALAAQGVMDNVIVVGATNVPELDSHQQRPKRLVLTTSNRHPFFVGLMAPGEKIKSALVNGQYGLADGTSEATAFVSGGAAALMALEPHWSAWQVKLRLIATADLWTGTALSDAVLAGEFNFKRALSDRDAVVIQRQTDNELCRGDLDPTSLTRGFVVKQGTRTSKVPWNQVLRIKRDNPTGTEYTIIYYMLIPLSERDNNQLLRLTKVTTAQVSGTDTFIFIPRDSNQCQGGTVSIFDLLDFVNKGPFPGSN